jgi:hypothetical protein
MTIETPAPSPIVVDPPPEISRESHLPLLKAALQATEGPVLELGSGDGSTPFLHEACAEQDRYLLTVESDWKWYKKWREMVGEMHRLALVSDWSELPLMPPVGKRWAVALVDNAPPKSRRLNVCRLQGFAEIVIVHDTEHEGPTSIYGFTPDIWLRWRHIVHDNRGRKGKVPKRTTALSDRIDITQWAIPA